MCITSCFEVYLILSSGLKQTERTLVTGCWQIWINRNAPVESSTPIHILSPSTHFLDFHGTLLVALDMSSLSQQLNLHTIHSGIDHRTHLRRAKATKAHHSHHSLVVGSSDLHLFSFLPTVRRNLGILPQFRDVYGCSRRTYDESNVLSKFPTIPLHTLHAHR